LDELPPEDQEPDVIDFPRPDRPRPESQVAPDPGGDEPFKIPEIELSGRQWLRLLTLLCSIIQDDEYAGLDVAKKVAMLIDQHMQSQPKFQEEVKKLLESGNVKALQLVNKLNLPPWER